MSSNQLLSEVLRKGSNKYNRVRQMARKCVKDSGSNMVCTKCSYDKHVEVSHIKAICDFDLSTPLSEVNHISNLLLLCPNCHWEHDNLEKIKQKQRNEICQCGNPKTHKSLKCVSCAQNSMADWRHKNSKIPTKDILLQLIEQKPFTDIGKEYGVSSNAVKKWCIKHNIHIENRRGYWAKKRTKVVGQVGF